MDTQRIVSLSADNPRDITKWSGILHSLYHALIVKTADISWNTEIIFISPADPPIRCAALQGSGGDQNILAAPRPSGANVFDSAGRQRRREILGIHRFACHWSSAVLDQTIERLRLLAGRSTGTSPHWIGSATA